MSPRQVRIVCASLALFLVPFASHSAIDDSHQADKVIVDDGHVSHDLGRLHNHATNWGLIGSMPTTGVPFSHAPSARWPGADGLDHLYSGGLWVGAVVSGEPLVTCASFHSEFRPTDAPGDTIQTAFRGMSGGLRYPWSGGDDDGDGREDEDPLDSRDNDGDGLVDEDCAAIGDQHYFATYADTAAVLQENYPDHQPLGIEVLQQSFQWMDPELADVVGYDFKVTNVGTAVLEDVHCGFFADFDIGDAADDRASGRRAAMQITDGPVVDLSYGFMVDGEAEQLGGVAGVVYCGLDTEAAAGAPADPETGHALRIFAGQQSFQDGGDPTNDEERYTALSTPTAQWDIGGDPPDDYRILLSAPAVPVLAPGESVTVRWALVVADAAREPDGRVNLHPFTDAAGWADITAFGRFFDRDDDPGNGEEFAVRWLSPQDQIVPVTTPRLRAGAGAGGVHLRCDLRGSSGVLAVERRSGDGVPWRRWSGWDGRAEILDLDPVGWPRTYDLLSRGADGVEKRVDSVEVAGLPTAGIRLDAGPNPFNPRLNISYYLPDAGHARLTVHSVRGELVRVLHDGPVAAGEGTSAWNGDDQTGRAQASGVYLVRLSTARRTVEERVTLVR